MCMCACLLDCLHRPGSEAPSTRPLPGLGQQQSWQLLAPMQAACGGPWQGPVPRCWLALDHTGVRDRALTSVHCLPAAPPSCAWPRVPAAAPSQVLVQQIAGPPPPPPLPPPPPPVQAPPRPPPSQEQPSRAQLDAAVKDVLDAVKEARDTAFTGPRLRANLTRKALLAADLRVLLTGHDIGVDVEDVDEAVVMAATQLHDAELLQVWCCSGWGWTCGSCACWEGGTVDLGSIRVD